MVFNYPAYRRLSVIILFFSLAAILSGCGPGQDTNQVLYIEQIGIDKGSGEKICVTYQFQNLKPSEEDDGKAQGKSDIKVIVIEGQHFQQTIEFLSSIISRTPNFAHIRALVFGEEIAREGIGKFLSFLFRFSEFRSSTYVVVVNNGAARDFIAKNKPTIEASASKYIETQMTLSKYTNIFLKSNIHEFYNRLKSNSAAPYAALGGINATKNGEDELDIAQELSGADDNIYAGNIPREGSVNPVELVGTAVFRQDKMVGKLNNRETVIASIFRRDFKRCIVEVDDPYAPGQKISVAISLARPLGTEVRLEDGNVKIDIALEFDCSLVNIPSGVNYEKRERREPLEKTIASYMRDKVKNMLDKSQNMGADIVGFGYKARTQFKTYPEFMNVKWDELYSRAEIDVNVAVKVKNSGLMRRTSPMSPTGFYGD